MDLSVLNDYMKDGVVEQGRQIHRILVNSEDDLETLDPYGYEPGCIAYTPGYANMWQLGTDGEWVEISISGGEGGSLNIHICTVGEYDAQTGIPTIEDPDENTIYLVPGTSALSPDLYVEWVYVNSAWEQFGSARIDLSDYVRNGAIAPVEASSTSSAAYAIGEYFWYNNTLYKATAAISIGGTITPNTNCTAAILGDDVADLKSAITPADYSATATYAVGDLCWHEGKMYRCSTAIDTAEAWTAAHWTEIVIPKDVRVNGVSVLDAQGVANVPMATTRVLGVVKMTGDAYGIYMGYDGGLCTKCASLSDIKKGGQEYKPIVPTTQHQSAFYGLAKAAGDTTQKASSNAVGTYTDEAKSAISNMLNGSVSVSGATPTINALPGIRYLCGEVATLDITLPASGIVDVVFQSGSTPTVLTITPPTGVTVLWANGFDPTALEANTVYEINIAEGLGVAGSWSL